MWRTDMCESECVQYMCRVYRLYMCAEWRGGSGAGMVALYQLNCDRLLLPPPHPHHHNQWSVNKT